MEGGIDFEKIESARLLNSSEYTLNSALGYISLKAALNQDEVLAVAYEYTYNGQVYQVGEFSTDGSEELRAPNALALKMLKSSANAPTSKGRGTWDLMMKNIYSLGATSINSDKFELYVMYRNDSVGTDMQYLTEGPVNGKQLIRVLNLDRLDQKNNVSPDGRFDFLEGITIMSASGKIIFPVLEPFGSYLAKQLGGEGTPLAKKYCFPELYDSTLVVAQEMSEKNKFRLTGKYKGTNSSEIRLGAMNVPRGSVTVTAGGATLVENVDYTVDYTMGTVTILNTSILESGTNVDVKLENQSTFSMQRKSLFGAHLEYEFNKDLVLGGTIMHLRERPLTTKVNMGSEPLANTIWGIKNLIAEITTSVVKDINVPTGETLIDIDKEDTLEGDIYTISSTDKLNNAVELAESSVQEIGFAAVETKDASDYGSNVGAEIVMADDGGSKINIDLSALRVDCGEY